MEQFLQYNKQNGMYVGNAALPDMDPAFGNTEVLLPGEEFVEGIVYRFDESIQMWRTLTLAQFEEHLREIMPELPTGEDDLVATFTTMIVELNKSNLALTMSVAKQGRTIDALNKRVDALEKGEEQ